ncbi:unnamed protein product [Cylicostephanus goldi]|uniref:Uncharacterized protein n=1 Tax=Cylicostephanus goldi TaxID=71465 RepID=A0A3P6T2J6_CYLGO|nr:unnamed protein product [Cylicostephanus goldi]
MNMELLSVIVTSSAKDMLRIVRVDRCDLSILIDVVLSRPNFFLDPGTPRFTCIVRMRQSFTPRNIAAGFLYCLLAK